MTFVLYKSVFKRLFISLLVYRNRDFGKKNILQQTLQLDDIDFNTKFFLIRVYMTKYELIFDIVFLDRIILT